jgi:hypothetical protein
MFSHQIRRCKRPLFVLAGAFVGVLFGLLVVGWTVSAVPAAPQAADVEVGPDYTKQASPEQIVTYNHTLTNTGTAIDTFVVEVLSAQNWPVVLSAGEGQGMTLTLHVGAQMTASFQVSLTVPADAAGVTEVTLITATSQLDPTARDTAIDTTIVPHLVYLPVVANHWPPLPFPPKLDAIDNADDNGFYTVTWAAADFAETYILEEDVGASFSNPTQVYNGNGLSWPVAGQGKKAGTYYYRVRGHNAWGYGAYSNVESVMVPPFRADAVQLPAGQCTTLRWEFDNVKSVHISFGYGYDKEGVSGYGTRQVCPSVTTTYEALVKRDSGSETYKVTINVSGTGCGDPVIRAFYANTYNVRPGEEFGIAWSVDCAKTVHLIIGDGPVEPVTGKGSTNLRIYATTLFTLKVQKSDDTFVYRTFTVYVSS